MNTQFALFLTLSIQLRSSRKASQHLNSVELTDTNTHPAHTLTHIQTPANLTSIPVFYKHSLNIFGKITLNENDGHLKIAVQLRQWFPFSVPYRWLKLKRFAIMFSLFLDNEFQTRQLPLASALSFYLGKHVWSNLLIWKLSLTTEKEKKNDIKTTVFCCWNWSNRLKLNCNKYLQLAFCARERMLASSQYTFRYIFLDFHFISSSGCFAAHRSDTQLCFLFVS